jgi:hypothetical protein
MTASGWSTMAASSIPAPFLEGVDTALRPVIRRVSQELVRAFGPKLEFHVDIRHPDSLPQVFGKRGRGQRRRAGICGFVVLERPDVQNDS